MKALKIIGKIILGFILGIILICILYSAYQNIAPVVSAKKEIADIEKYARTVDDLGIDENVKVIGLGEATHGNKEYHALKLQVLKTLVENYNVTAYGMEMDYGEGVLIDQYINGKSDKTIDEVMENISFGIYDTIQMQELIEWMKDYNSEYSDTPLRFYGFDMQNPDKDLAVVSEFMKKNHILEDFHLSEEFDGFVNGEFTFRDDRMQQVFDDLMIVKTEFTEHSDMYEDLEGYEYMIACIDNIFRAKELSAVGNDSVAYGNYRDMHMAELVEQALDAETSRSGRLMISGHIGHIGYAGSYVKTMGSYIKESIGDAYFAIGTDAFKSNVCFVNREDTSENHRFFSGDILAYQSKNIGTYYLKFSDIPENSEVFQYIHDPINMQTIGAKFSLLNYVLPQTVRIKVDAVRLYDGMILIYETTPLELR